MQQDQQQQQPAPQQEPAPQQQEQPAPQEQTGQQAEVSTQPQGKVAGDTGKRQPASKPPYGAQSPGNTSEQDGERPKAVSNEAE